MHIEATQRIGAEPVRDASKIDRAGHGSGLSGLLLSVPDAARFLGIGKWALRGLIASRKVPVVKVGRAFYLRRAALTKWAESAERFVR